MTSPTTSRPRVDPQGASWPALIPLRPLSIGEIFAASLRLLQRRALVLAPITFVAAMASAGAQLGILASFPADQRVLPADWMDRAMAGRLTIPPGVLWPTLAGALFGFLITILVSGIAAALTAADVISIDTPARVALQRLRGSWWRLLVVAALVAAAVTLGLTLLVVPALLAVALLGLAAPALALERASIGAALRRSIELSRGLRLRIVGAVVLALILSSFVGILIGSFVPLNDTTSSLVASILVGGVISAFTTPWVAGVIALLYTDARIRKENLAWSLNRAARR